MRHACHRLLNIYVIRSLALLGMYFVLKNSHHSTSLLVLPHKTIKRIYNEVPTTATVRLANIPVSMANK